MPHRRPAAGRGRPIVEPVLACLLVATSPVPPVAGAGGADAPSPTANPDDVPAVWGDWGPVADIAGADGLAHGPRVAIDASGDAIATWTVEVAGSRTELRSNSHRSGAGWSAPTPVDASASEASAYDAQVAVDAVGNALAVWTQVDAATGLAGVWASRHAQASGWGTPTRLMDGPHEAVGVVSLAVHPDGHGAAAWARTDGSTMQVMASRYTPADGWSEPERIDDAILLAEAPALAFAPDGRLLAAWRQSSTGTPWDVVACWHAPGAGWGPVAALSTDGTGAAGAPRVAIDATGAALVAWVQDTGPASELRAASHTGTTGWGIPVLVETANELLEARLVMAGEGRALLAWVRPVEVAGVVRLWAFASRLVPGTGWSTPVTVNEGDSLSLSAGLAPDGRSLIAWHEFEAGRRLDAAWAVRVSRTLDGTDWDAPETVGDWSRLPSGPPQVALGPHGGAMVVWAVEEDVRAALLG